MRRIVNSDIWESPLFKGLSAPNTSGQFMLLFLLTCDSLVLPGVILKTPDQIATSIGWSKQRVLRAMEELSGKRVAFFSEDYSYVVIPDAIRSPYNRPSNPNIATRWGRSFNALPNSRTKYAIYVLTLGYLCTVSETCAKAFREAADTELIEGVEEMKRIIGGYITTPPQSFGSAFAEWFGIPGYTKQPEKEKDRKIYDEEDMEMADFYAKCMKSYIGVDVSSVKEDAANVFKLMRTVGYRSTSVKATGKRYEPAAVTPQTLKAVIRFAVSDPFWKTLVVNPVKLRENYLQIYAKMRGAARAVATGDEKTREEILAKQKEELENA